MATAEQLDVTINGRGGLNIPPIESQDINLAFERAAGLFTDVSLYSAMELFSSGDRVLDVRYVNNAQIGAFCATHPPDEFGIGVDFVGIHTGSVPAIYNAFLRILSRKDTFEYVGNVDLEVDDRSYTPYLSHKMELRSDFKFTCPNCPVRFNFALLLADLALEFILLHEIAHLKNGHVDWLESDHFALISAEDKNLRIQACEMDADSEAVRWVMNRRFERAHRRAALPLGTTCTVSDWADFKLMENPQKLIHHILYGVYIVFRLFDSKLWSLSSQKNGIHPTHPARQSMIITTIGEIIKGHRYYAYSIEEYISNLPLVIASAEKSFAFVQDIKPDPSRILSVYENGEFSDYIEMLGDAWSSIRPELMGFQRSQGKLAP
jgi:hypothetical protein